MITDPIDLGKGYFGGISKVFPNLKTVYVTGSGIDGTLNKDSFDGLEHVHNFFLHGTSLEGFPERVFEKFQTLKCKYSFISKITIKLEYTFCLKYIHITFTIFYSPCFLAKSRDN